MGIGGRTIAWATALIGKDTRETTLIREIKLKIATIQRELGIPVTSVTAAASSTHHRLNSTGDPLTTNIHKVRLNPYEQL